MINYFQNNGARPITGTENPAEYILDVIGAGATATTDVDWFSNWKVSKEAVQVEREIEHIHAEGRKKPQVQATFPSTFATSWIYQVRTLLIRNAQYFWRDPTYIFSKLALNAVGGLFIGFTFWQSPNTQQGTQNRVFVSASCYH